MYQKTTIESSKKPNSEQYLSFVLADEEYAVDILSVLEIKSWEPVTPIPNTPGYVKGFINLRGKVVPIIDLRQRFNLELVEYTETTVVIILNSTKEKYCKTYIGIIVDAVSEVYDIEVDAISEAPNLGSQIDTNFIKGITEIDNKMIILTDVHVLLDAEEFFSHDDS